MLLAHLEEMLQKVVKMLDEESRGEAWRELDVLVRQLTEVQAMESLVKALQALASTPGGHGLEQLHITMWRRPRKYVNEESRISMPLETTVLELPGVQCFPQLQLLAVDMLEVPALADEQTWRDDEPARSEAVQAAAAGRVGGAGAACQWMSRGEPPRR